MAFYLFDLDGTLALNNPRTHFLDPGVDAVCDICPNEDGEPYRDCTQCHGEGHYMKKDWDAFFDACDKDTPNQPVIDLMIQLDKAGHEVQIWTGRVGSVRVLAKTIYWLEKHGCLREWLTNVRPEKNHIHDNILKGSWLDERRAAGLPDPVMVFDDRNSVVEMWRAKGLCCAQVALGDF